MQQRQLGTQGLVTSALGLGCMGMSDTPHDVRRLDDVIPRGAAAGARYAEGGMKTVNA